jgi:energy-coupling factor transporter transmembrane protein EcfT
MKKPLRTVQIILCLVSFVMVFIVPGLKGQLAVLAVFLFLSAMNAQRKAIFSMLLKMSPLIFFTLFVHLFFRFGEQAYWSALTEQALWTKALYFSFRNGNILFIMSYLIQSGPKISLSAISSFLDGRKPEKFLQPLTLAVRYTGLIRDEFRSIQQVHRIMGIKRPKRLISQVRYYTSLLLPTIISSLERAEHLSIAMTTRGYNLDS